MFRRRLVTARRADWTTSARDAAALFSVSPDVNVVVVLLDGLQSDIAAGVLEQHPEPRAAFDGFSFYPDTLAAAPTTFLGLPAIHSGEVYTGDTTPAEALHAIDRQPVVRDAVRRGRYAARSSIRSTASVRRARRVARSPRRSSALGHCSNGMKSCAWSICRSSGSCRSGRRHGFGHADSGG